MEQTETASPAYAPGAGSSEAPVASPGPSQQLGSSSTPVGTAGGGESSLHAAHATGYIKARGLPFSAGPEDIQTFFATAGVQLADVFISKRNGRSTGEAYVQLVDASQTNHAIDALNRQHMGSRYIELFAATEADMATARALTVDRLRGYVVRMRGLPYSASASDVLRFLDGIEVVRGVEGVIFTWTPDGRPTGEAFVELKDETAQCEAMKRHKELMGTRYIEMFTSTKAALIQAIQHNRLILGFSNRKKWLQQAGVPTQQPQLVMTQHGSLYPVVTTQRIAGIGEITDGFAGMGLGGQQLRGMGMMQAGPVGVAGGAITSAAAPGTAILQAQDVRAFQGMGPGGMPVGLARHSGSTSTASSALHLDPSGQMRSLRPGAVTQQVVQQTTYMSGQPFSGMQQVAGPSGMVMQQPYIIQQPTTQYVTMDGGYAGGAQSLITAGTSQDAYSSRNLRASPGQSGGQYVVSTGPGGYAVQTIQIQGDQNLQHLGYLQLGGPSTGELQGSFTPGGSMPLNMEQLSSTDAGQPSIMLHPQ